MLNGAAIQLNDLLGIQQFAARINIHKSLLVKSVRAGDAKTRLRGRGLEFEEVRHYQAGDELRALDWRVTARTGVPHTKLFQEERERPIIIAVDQRLAMAFGSQQRFKSVLAAEVAAALAWAALHQKDRVGGLIFNDNAQFDMRPSGNRKSVLRFLNQLSTFNRALIDSFDTTNSTNRSPNAAYADHSTTTQTLSLATVSKEVLRIAKPGSSVFMISDFNQCCDTTLDHITRLRRHCNVHPILIYDEMEKTLPTLGHCAFTDGLSKQSCDTNNRALRQQFTQQFTERVERLSCYLLDHGIPLIKIATHQQALSLLQQIFSDKARRTSVVTDATKNHYRATKHA